MAGPVTQLQREALQNRRMAVVQDAWEMKGPWTQMFWAEAVTNSTLKKMRKPSLPGAVRMLIYSGLGPRQCFHIDGSGATLLSREEQKLIATRSTSCFSLPALWREVKIPNVCMANTMVSLRDMGHVRSRAGLWEAHGESLNTG